MRVEEEVKEYIRKLLNVGREEVWDWECMEEIADDMLGNEYVRVGGVSNKRVESNR
ncbi:SAUGI family uracil-DNA glycosylase inhibitor [Staphylococcus epidermidis]|uniref:SAUGI family uracil-DNA glycosylase inhibitor n=1 Tax=Staphylococcus epidermidis TaxID=1282 RepID=UPI001642C305|nr:SAUGI family uracil-DNA glycosylase inhibitor [Staphylococcus epidermidis]